ncbi:glycosyltransferase family 4 protein [Actinomyces vulturis]|uniref:glycosyltransferase family 4 protein n=1 Tax=Actinomyces vulturis TaxID=1857645 RepID=UPI0008355BEF|nr:glycosyltransferase family 4 protein [Actinomyces vulturis]
MRQTLLITNDFPPVVGGIQSYLDDYTRRLDSEALTVLCSTPPGPDGVEAGQEWDAQAPFDVHRMKTSMLLPTPDVAAQMRRIIEEKHIETVWFGAAAPMGLLGGAAKKAGATKVIATTHGHEIGWGMVPGGHAAVKKIFADADVITYISQYTLSKLSKHIGNKPVVHLPSGIDIDRFHPQGRKRLQLRKKYGIGEAPTAVCVSRLVPRKGQDALIEAWPRVVEQISDARLVIVGWGAYAKHLAMLKRKSPVRDHIILTGPVDYDQLPAHVAMADVFAMPCRTRWGGLDLEGLGIVFLEASACEIPVIAGDSGGAPETVIEGETGLVVNGRDEDQLVDALVTLLGDPQKAARMGIAGRKLMEEQWTWPHLVERLVDAIDSRP